MDAKQREQFWREALAAWQASGLSVRQYCRRHDLAEPSFYHWRRELQRRVGRPASSSAPAFVPVTVLPAGERPAKYIVNVWLWRSRGRVISWRRGAAWRVDRQR